MYCNLEAEGGGTVSSNAMSADTSGMNVSNITIAINHTLSQKGLQPQWRALQDILNDSFICYQDLSEYDGL